MQLRTPKRYSPRRQKRALISLRWLWLYLLAPVVILGSVLAYNFRVPLGVGLATKVAGFKFPVLNPETPTPTIPAQSIESRIQSRLKSGDMTDALTAMEQFSQSNLNDTKWHVMRAVFLALRADGDPLLMQQAIDAGTLAINAAPESSTSWAAEAMALDWSNVSNDSAIETQALVDALHALDLSNTDPKTLATLAGIYVSLNKLDLASTTADAALKQDPNTSYAYFVKGQIAALNGNSKAATNFFKQAWDISLNDPTQWGGLYAYYLAGQFIIQGQIDQAKNILTDGLRYDKDYPRFGRQLSDLYFNQGQYPQAIAAAQQCTDTNPTYAPCWAVLPKLFSRDKQFDKASRAGDNAKNYGSVETSPYYWGGEAYYQLNDCAHAIPLFQAGYQLAARKADSSVVGDFVDALNQCGLTPPQLTVTPTPGGTSRPPVPTPTTSPTATATPTKKAK